MSFHLLFKSRPPSGSKPKFKERLRAAASERTQSTLKGDLVFRVVWFHRDPSPQDVDNILKSLFDALKGTVYIDDSTIVRVQAEKVHYRGAAYELDAGALPPADVEDLQLALASEAEHVLMIAVDLCEKPRQISFGGS